jgi:hypothetical protein
MRNKLMVDDRLHFYSEERNINNSCFLKLPLIKNGHEQQDLYERSCE